MSKNMQPAEREAGMILKEIGRYKVWHYRERALRKRISFFRGMGIRVVSGDGFFSLERTLHDSGETLKITFERNGAIRGEFFSGNGRLGWIPLDPTERLLIQLILGCAVVAVRSA